MGETMPQREEWPRLQYVLLRGVKRSQAGSPKRVRLPITADLMACIQQVLFTNSNDPFHTKLIWAACCLAFFGFLRCGEFTLSRSSETPAIWSSDVAVDSHSDPSTVRIHLRRAKCDPYRHLHRKNQHPRLPSSGHSQLSGSSTFPTGAIIYTTGWYTPC